MQQQKNDALVFDYEATVQVGHLIGRAALTGSEFEAYPVGPPTPTDNNAEA